MKFSASVMELFCENSLKNIIDEDAFLRYLKALRGDAESLLGSESFCYILAEGKGVNSRILCIMKN